MTENTLKAGSTVLVPFVLSVSYILCMVLWPSLPYSKIFLYNILMTFCQVGKETTLKIFIGIVLECYLDMLSVDCPS